jgi:hypothetical protein
VWAFTKLDVFHSMSPHFHVISSAINNPHDNDGDCCDKADG